MPSSYPWRPADADYYNSVALAATAMSSTTEHVSRNEVLNMAVQHFFTSGAYEQELAKRRQKSDAMKEAIAKLEGS